MSENGTPSFEEIATLPRWAQVAFAARCARRVFPLFTEEPLYAEGLGIPLVRRAIDLAEQFASGSDRSEDDVEKIAAVATKVYEVSGGTNSSRAAASTALTAARAAAAAFHARATDPASLDATAARIEAVAKAASSAVQQAGFFKTDAQPEIRRDFKTVLELSMKNAWTDDTPVPPSVFGPIWPDGTPDGWPEEVDSNDIILEIDVPDDATDEELLRIATDLAIRADALDREGGGHGLDIEELEITAEEPVSVPVGGPQ
jgi:hypothetical protein